MASNTHGVQNIYFKWGNEDHYRIATPTVHPGVCVRIARCYCRVPVEGCKGGVSLWGNIFPHTSSPVNAKYEYG